MASSETPMGRRTKRAERFMGENLGLVAGGGRGARGVRQSSHPQRTKRQWVEPPGAFAKLFCRPRKADGPPGAGRLLEAGATGAGALRRAALGLGQGALLAAVAQP